MRGLIKNSNYDIEYFVYGTGNKILLAFHGFNNHAEDFKVFGNTFGNEYTIVAINLFFHGQSQAQNHIVEKGFSIYDLKNLFDEIADLFPAEKYSLMGYSLGGRIVLKLIEIYPEKIEKIILLAPDGIRISIMYRFLTQTFPGNRLLKRVVDNPSIFFSLAGFLRKTGLLGEKKYQFTLGNYDSKTKRQKVYQVWMVLRKIISKKSEVKNAIRKNNLPVALFFGEYDLIIPPSIGKKFQKGMGKYMSLHILKSGHKLLKEDIVKEIYSRLMTIKNDFRKI